MADGPIFCFWRNQLLLASRFTDSGAIGCKRTSEGKIVLYSLTTRNFASRLLRGVNSDLLFSRLAALRSLAVAQQADRECAIETHGGK